MYVVPAAILLAITLPHLGQGDFRTDTGWYSAISLSSVRHWGDAHGIRDLLTLQAEPGKPFFNKPPLALWIHGVVLHMFGVSLEAARLPTVLAACLCVVLTVAIVLSQSRGGLVSLAVVLVFTLVLAGFFAWSKFSDWGIAVRASAEDPRTAELMGVRLGRVSATVWLIAAVLAVLAGVFLSAFPAPGVSPTTSASHRPPKAK